MSVRHVTISSLCAMLQVILVAAAAAQEPRPAEGLRFVGSARNEPFSFLNSDGQPAGFDVEVLALVAGKLGRSINVELLADDELAGGSSTPLTIDERARQKVLAGLADGLVGAGIPPAAEAEKTRDWLFCGPTTAMEYAIAVRAADRCVSTVETLHGTRVAVVKDDSILSVFSRNESISVIEVRNVLAGCRLLDGQWVTAFVAPRSAVQYAAGQGHLKNLKFVGSTIWSLDKYGPAVPAGKRELAGQIEKAVAELEQQGELAKLRRKYFAYEMHTVHFWQLSWVKISAIGLLLAGAAAAITMAWRRNVNNRVLAATRRVHAEMEVLRKQLAEMGEAGRHHTKLAHPPAEAAEQAAAEALTPLALNEFLQGSRRLFQEALGGDGITLSMHLAEDLPAVMADPDRLQDALIQLCRNARDAVTERHNNDPAVSSRAWLSTRMAKAEETPPRFKSNGQSFVAVSLRDDGVGIAAEMVQKIFERGFTTKHGAAGQGLAVVYQTAAYHRGWIDVESAPGRGATFSLFLPTATD